MYSPPAFSVSDAEEIRAIVHACRLATFVTATDQGPLVTPLPMIFDEHEGPHGTLYGHMARANPQWQVPTIGDSLALFSGPDAYVSPSWYAAKAEHGKVVPTWNYVAVEARGPVEFFDDPTRLRDCVTRLTERHEGQRAAPWAVSDAPEAFIAAHLRGIVGLRIPITAVIGKKKLSQNRPEADRAGVKTGLAASADPMDRIVGALIPE
ncbi:MULTISPECIES: FMN-binding negative transcriptional regulator [Alphaproteobacteria]|uniref:Transcriptional regulator n=2 Tax=Alphaproteobacteria TaxID=28211 RepID=A0A512HFX5_9HYPH|nr:MULTISPECIES: FMN-binding negative transcriptional regulator [Alphaproteobacteria]GEO84353.1 transcriptional regulator [Ciceribacter naphthalenivorans]GLR24890.1 transcriptional regulator [Ciceribacter naphthalenivorans]GLT07746.1 transcriptional regulator [Sphingomonas psychrolutea]